MVDSEPPAESEPVATPARPRARLIALIASGAALLVVLAIVIAFLVVPRGEPVALVDDQTPESTASASASPTATPTTTPTPTPTAAAPVVAAPAPAAPAAPAPAAPAPAPAPPALPAPPAPVIPPLKITSMDAYASTPCGSQGHVMVTWSATGANPKSAILNVRSGGGTPVFNQSWTLKDPTDYEELFTVDCTRPIWYFKLTVSNGTTSKSALLTFANGKNVGWSGGQ